MWLFEGMALYIQCLGFSMVSIRDHKHFWTVIRRYVIVNGQTYIVGNDYSVMIDVTAFLCAC